MYGDPADANDGIGADPGPAARDEIPPGVGAVPDDEWTYPQTTQPTPTDPGQHCPAAGCTWDDFDPSTTSAGRSTATRRGRSSSTTSTRSTTTCATRPGIGFDQRSGNFEGADRVQAQVDDGSTTDVGMFDDFPDCDHTGNAYALPVPDGQPLFIQIYLWSNACTALGLALNDVNAADDGLIVYHEYTHGMTNRLVTDAGGFPALNGAQPGAMDEGFADWYALDFLTAQGFETDTAAPGELKAGSYENDTLRSQAWDCPVGAAASACPGGGTAGTGGYTYGDFGRISGLGAEVHADGEIWVETLWDLRTRMIAAHGADDRASTARARSSQTAFGWRPPTRPSSTCATRSCRRTPTAASATARSSGRSSRRAAWASARSRRGNNDTAPVQDFSLPPPGVTTPPPTPDRTKPKITRASMKRKRFKVGVRSAFTFTLSEISTVEIAISRAATGRRSKGRCRPATRKLRKRPRCTRYVAAGSLVRINMSAGAHSVGFAGKLRGRALKTGAYKATIRATDPSGNHSRATTTSFRIVRR